jgi:GNAT superfamily N-acetyltransferase
VSDYTVKPLVPDTWDAFARIAERHNGVFGGCWCTWFHTLHAEKTFEAEGNRALKQRWVNEGRAHAALVFDGDAAVAWCEYGTPAELPNIYHRKEYEANLDRLPDYRITCLFVDKKYRRKGMTAVALRGALDLIAQAGGGMVGWWKATRTTPTVRRCRSSTTAPGASSSRPASAMSGPRA